MESSPSGSPWHSSASSPLRRSARAALERVSWSSSRLLLVAANVHPWYLAWLCAARRRASPAAFLWVALMPLAYAVLADYRATARGTGSTARRWWIYLRVAAWLVVESACGLARG